MRSVYRFITPLAFSLVVFSCSTTRRQPVVSATMNELAQGYVDKYAQMAVSEMKRTGIPASITLAQGMLESDFGRSSLTTQGNNHFGIKCHNNWTGAKIYHDDETKNECFRRYKNAEESFRDHSDYLVNTPRYKTLFSLSSKDYKGWAHGLKKAGYATNPQYASMLIDNIEKYGLYEYDSGAARKPVRNISQVPPGENSVQSTRTYDNVNSSGGIVLNAGQGRVKEVNRAQYIIVRDGDTYESLADEFQLLKWEISKYNEIPADSPLKPGQIIFLQPKRNKADVGFDTHIVREGDTMYLISQQYGIKLEALYEMNFMDAGTEPAIGKKIKLR
jgi:LysM repeat protein